MKITDKMRLDFLTNEGAWLSIIPSGEYVVDPDMSPVGCGFDTPRQAIDAAIRAEKKGRE